MSCGGCYQNFKGDWWCDNCDQWPCVCTDQGGEKVVGGLTGSLPTTCEPAEAFPGHYQNETVSP